MGVCNQRGSKLQRQNQHQRRLMAKIARFNKRGWKVDGLERELARSLGDEKHKAFRTGRDADPRYQKNYND
jgi:hypothetical protein